MNIFNLIKIKANGFQDIDIWFDGLRIFTGQNLNRAYKHYKTREKKLMKKIHLI